MSEFSISKQALQYHLSTLKRAGLIKVLGHGVIHPTNKTIPAEVKKTTRVAHDQPGKLFKGYDGRIRGHAFMVTFSIPRIDRWGERELWLDRKGVDWKPLNLIGGGQGFTFKGRRVWLTDRSIIVYERDSFVADNARGSRNYAMVALSEFMSKLEGFFGVRLRHASGWKFRVSRQHYARVNDALARYCNRRGEKIKVYAKGALWFLIDASFNLDEAETVDADSGVEDMDGVVSPWMNRLKENPGLVDMMLGAIQRNAEHLEFHAENMRSHVKAVRDLGEGSRDLTETVKRLACLVEELKGR